MAKRTRIFVKTNGHQTDSWTVTNKSYFENKLIRMKTIKEFY